MKTKYTTKKLMLDPVLDACGYITLREDDGSEHGNTDTQPVATIYDAECANVLAAAPELLEAAQHAEKLLSEYLARDPQKARLENVVYWLRYAIAKTESLK